jgi:hypothetical protein
MCLTRILAERLKRKDHLETNCIKHGWMKRKWGDEKAGELSREEDGRGGGKRWMDGRMDGCRNKWRRWGR